MLECNPEKDIITNRDTIQTQNEITHIYDNTDKYLTTISTIKLKWLWKKYNIAIYNTHSLVLPPQSFETEII